jgi:4-hydroxybenzoate polyprenyltransferase
VGDIREYMKLIRPYGILFLGFTPVFGAVCNGELDAVHLSLLLIIGLLAHVFTFVQNDYYDIEVDRQSKYVVQRPLTTGVITRSHAFTLVLFSFFVSMIIAAVFLFSLRSFALLLVSFFFITLYNKYSKRVSGMEFFLGAGVFSCGIFGALTVNDTITPLAFIISSLGFLQWVFSVGVSANLKDVEFDTKLGIRTTPVILGVKAVGSTLKKPVVFFIYAYGVKIVHLLVAFSPFLLGYTSLLVFDLPIPLAIFLLLGSVILLTTYGVLSSSLEKRDRMLRYEGLQEGLSLLLIPCVLLSYLVNQIGVVPTVLLFLVMILWPLFILRVLYGKTLIPLE